MPSVDNFQMNCPVPRPASEHVLLGHGSGGTLSADLVQRIFLPELGNELLNKLEDQATINFDPVVERLAFTTDAFVVRPLFFPGGDIGKLAVHGTVNDLAVGGARPMYLSAAFILEEGLPFDDLRRIDRERVLAAVNARTEREILAEPR